MKETNSNIEPRSWDSIINTYKSIDENSYLKMIELVSYIKNSDFKNKLFGTTSLTKLIISIYNPMQFNRETLHIDFDPNSNKWHFQYFSLPFQDPEFIRTYDSNDGIRKFNQIIKFLKW
jgi:hypothetical protein